METELSVYSRLMTVNFLGVVELSRNLVPDMVTRAAGGGAMAPGSPGLHWSLGNMNWLLIPVVDN